MTALVRRIRRRLVRFVTAPAARLLQLVDDAHDTEGDDPE